MSNMIHPAPESAFVDKKSPGHFVDKKKLLKDTDQRLDTSQISKMDGIDVITAIRQVQQENVIKHNQTIAKNEAKRIKKQQKLDKIALEEEEIRTKWVEDIVEEVRKRVQNRKDIYVREDNSIFITVNQKRHVKDLNIGTTMIRLNTALTTADVNATVNFTSPPYRRLKRDFIVSKFYDANYEIKKNLMCLIPFALVASLIALPFVMSWAKYDDYRRRTKLIEITLHLKPDFFEREQSAAPGGNGYLESLEHFQNIIANTNVIS